MRRRRVNRERRALVWALVGCFAVYILLVIANLFSDNEGAVRDALAKEMVDTTGPVIELTGGESVTVAVGDRFVEPGFVIYDDRSVPRVEVESAVNNHQTGEYSIIYSAVDASGNRTEAKRTVKVMEPAGWVYLTFDDGPSDYTGALLDILKKYGVKATFFVTNYGDDALIRRAYDEGHAVGLHTASHVYSYLYASVENYAADLDAVQERVRNITGKTTRLMRFPGGSSNMISSYYDGGTRIMSTLSRLVTEWGYTYFDWNVDSGDAGGADNPDQVFSNVVNGLKAGGSSVVLQHDTKPYSVEAVEKIIQYGLEHNYIFDRLSQESFTAHHGVNN